MLLSAERINKAYGTRTLLDGVTLHLEKGDRVGVVGLNGAGKSTLLRILTGVEEADAGTVTLYPNVRLDYLSQAPEFDPNNTVLEQVFAGLSAEARLLEDYEAKSILTKLDITDFDRPLGELSGGQRKRVAMASALVHPCDVLILDEPTNHLDSEMIDWLEDRLRRFSGALVMVTHDRYFLERITNHMVEVDGGNLYSYSGNYSSYLEQKLQREEMTAASERKRQSILRREYQWVMQGPKARGTKSRERLERYDTLKEQEGPAQREKLELSAFSGRLGKKTIELQKVSKAFGGRTVLRDFDAMLLRNDRIGIVGVNGSGKSTLLNLIAGRIAPDSGEVITGETVRIGYFAQETPYIDPSIRVIDFMKEIGERVETPEGMLTASQMLEKFLFPGDVQWSPVSKLSGGERRRLFLLSILLAAPNVLLLDEPTNDLDIETLTILEDYLETFPGPVIVVSHDRYLLDKVVNRVFAVGGDGCVQVCPGGYTEYLELRRQSLSEKQPEKPKGKEKPVGRQKLKFSFKEQREFETIDDDIAALEEKLGANRKEQDKNAADYVALTNLQ
jgi:ATP-binding cassette subfamily F protein uup